MFVAMRPPLQRLKDYIRKLTKLPPLLPLLLPRLAPFTHQVAGEELRTLLETREDQESRTIVWETMKRMGLNHCRPCPPETVLDRFKDLTVNEE